jgi:hypothetical protein
MAIQIPELELTTAYRAKDGDYWQQLFVAQRCVNAVRAVKESSQQLGCYTALIALDRIPQDVGFDDYAAQIMFNEIHCNWVPDLKVENRREKKRRGRLRQKCRPGRMLPVKRDWSVGVPNTQCDKFAESLVPTHDQSHYAADDTTRRWRARAWQSREPSE